MLKDKQVKALSKYFTKPVFSEVDVKLMRRNVGSIHVGFVHKGKHYIVLVDNASYITDGGFCVLIAVKDGLSVSAYLGITQINEGCWSCVKRSGAFTDGLAGILVKQSERNKTLEEAIKKSRKFKEFADILDKELTARKKEESL